MSNGDKQSQSNCLICGNEILVNSSFNIFYTVIPHTGTLLANLVQKVIHKSISNSVLPSYFTCASCFTLFEQLDYSEDKCISLKRSIINSYNANCQNNSIQLEYVPGVACQTEEIVKEQIQDTSVLKKEDNDVDTPDFNDVDDITNTDVQATEENGNLNSSNSAAEESAKTPSSTQTQNKRKGRPSKKLQATKNLPTKLSNGKDFAVKIKDVRSLQHYVHPCSLCGRLFRRPCEVKQHLLSHGGAKPYKCRDCGRRFGSKSGAGIHALKKHGKDVSAENIIEVCKDSKNCVTESSESTTNMVERGLKVKNDSEDQSNSESSSDDDFEWKMDENEIFGTSNDGEEKYEALSASDENEQGSQPNLKTEIEAPSDGNNDFNDQTESNCSEKKKIISVSSDKTTSKASTTKSSADKDEKITKKTRKDQRRKKEPVPKVPKHECTICGKMWRTMSEFKSHVATHSDERPFICEICGQAYKHKQALDIHVGMHNGINPFCCPFCNKAFTQKGALQRHMPIHTGEAPFQCELCGKRFVHHTSFNMHTLAHTGQKSYKCGICGLALLSGSHLKRHSRVHTGERPYQCQTCGKRFAERYNLVAHTRVHDTSGTVGSREGSGKKVHRCQLCGAGFDRKTKLDDHLALCHHKVTDSDDNRKWVGHIISGELNQQAVNMHISGLPNLHQHPFEIAQPPAPPPPQPTQQQRLLHPHGEAEGKGHSTAVLTAHQPLVTSVPVGVGQHQQNWHQMIFGNTGKADDIMDNALENGLNKMSALGGQHRLISEMSALGGMSGHSMGRNMLTSCLAAGAGHHLITTSNHSHHLPNPHTLSQSRLNMFSTDN